MAERESIIYGDILKVIDNVLLGLKNEDAKYVKEWSDHIIHNASIFQDKHSIRVSIIIYALSKIFEKWKYEGQSRKHWLDFWKSIIVELRTAKTALKNNDLKVFSQALNKITKLVGVADKEFSEHIQYVLDKARVSKAWKIYEHGVSLGRVAELLGVSEWEAMSYLGSTRTHDYPELLTESVKERYDAFKKLVKRR